MRARALALLATLALLPLAGCLSDDDGPDLPGPGDPGYVAPMEPFVNPIDLDHNHTDISLHTHGNNIDLVGHVDFGLDPTVTLGEIDFAGDHAYVAVFGHGFAIVDVKDPANPTVLSEWSALPSFRDSENASHAGAFSLHNFQVVDGKVYIAMGHGGIWVIDVSTPEKLRAPEPVGSYYPHQPRRDNESYSIYPWDVVVKDGYVLNAVGNTGLYVLHFRDDPAGDETYDSFA